MGYLNYNLEKVASVVRAVAKLAGPSASKVNLASKLKLKSKIKPQSKSIDLSNSDASWLDTPDLRAQLSTAPKVKLSKLPTAK